MRKGVPRWFGFVLILLFFASGCATTSTHQAELSPEVLEAEEARQRQLAIRTHERQQRILDDVAFPIAENAVSLCKEDTTRRGGYRVANAFQYEDEWRTAAERALGLGEKLQVIGVAEGSPADQAGLEIGDVILELDGRPVPGGDRAAEQFGEMLEKAEESGRSKRELVVRREEKRVHLELEETLTCEYPATVVSSGELNAFADGDGIYITSAMMRFVEPEELPVVVAHELAHNAMDHIEKKQSNSLLGALVGALGDVAMAASGVNTGGYYASQGAQLGSEAHSQDFEREADYVGMYALALAGYPLNEAPRFWRHMAQADPSSIGLAHTHPTTAERFVRLERNVEEITWKRERGLTLRPEAEDETGPYATFTSYEMALSPAEFEHPEKDATAFREDRRSCAEEAVELEEDALVAEPAASIQRQIRECLSGDFGWSVEQR